MTLTTVQAQVTKTNASTASFKGAGIDISGITGDWTLKVNVAAMADSVTANAPVVRFQFVDTVDDYTHSVVGPTLSFKGTIASSYDRVRSFKKQDFPDLRVGVASAQLRLDMSNLQSYVAGAAVPAATTTCTTTYSAWIES